MGEALEYRRWQPRGELHEVPCAGCDGREARLLAVENGLPVVRCNDCGLVYVNRHPSRQEIAEYYEHYFLPESGPLWDAASGMVYDRICERPPLSDRAGGGVLDVGCGYGAFLERMRARGWQVQGVEIAPDCLRVLRETKEIPVFEGSLAEAAFPARSFDVVSMWYVLEHLPDPRPDLAEALRVLRPGGTLIVQVPNMDFYWGFLALRRLGLRHHRFHVVDPPGHFFAYSRATLSRFLERTGFVQVRVEPGDPWNPGGALLRFIRTAVTAVARGMWRASGERWLVAPSILALARAPHPSGTPATPQEPALEG